MPKKTSSFNPTSPKTLVGTKYLQKKLLDELASAVSERNKLEAVLQTMDNGVYGVDWDGKLSLFSKSAEEITGWKKEEVLGHYCQDILKVRGQKGESVCEQCPLAQSFVTGETVLIPLCSITAKDGKLIKVASTYSPIKGVKNDLVSGIGVFRDLRKEEELERMKSDFVTMAAHELRTPITSLKGYLSVLIEEGKNLDDEQKLFLERSFISASKLESLTNNLLSVAKIERGTLPINLTKLVIQDVAQEAISLILPKAEEKGIKIQLKSKIAYQFQIKADREKIKEVLINFLNNAITYTPAGKRILVILDKTDRKLRVKIKDSGIGFNHNTQKHLFEKFYREHREGTPIQGTGLGLYISKMIVGLHHGSVFADSAGRNKGSTFGFEIPVEKAQASFNKFKALP